MTFKGGTMLCRRGEMLREKNHRKSKKNNSEYKEKEIDFTKVRSYLQFKMEMLNGKLGQKNF